MGRPDQLAKRILREETGAATGQHVAFETPAEVPVGALTPDGIVRVEKAPGLDAWPVPWCRLRVEATLDIKMPGDHCDRASHARAELRRHARWVQSLEAQRELARSAPTPIEALDPRNHAAWFVAPTLARWVQEDAARGLVTVEPLGPGCWRLGLGVHESLWIGANELPLRPELIPFLVARSGRAQAEFLAWSATVKGPAWTWSVVQDLPMSAETADEFVYVPDDPEEQRRIKARYTKRLLEAYPEAANDLLDQSRAEAMRHAVVAVLSARGIALRDEHRARLAAASASQVDAWLVAAATAATADDALR